MIKGRIRFIAPISPPRVSHPCFLPINRCRPHSSNFVHRLSLPTPPEKLENPPSFHSSVVFVFAVLVKSEKEPRTKDMANTNQDPSRLWTFLTLLHSLAGPVLMLLYPLYASVIAIESPSKVDDEQWLAYWIIYSFLTLMEMLLQPVLEWIPFWYDLKLVFVAWLVLPQFKGAAFLYHRFVRENIRKYGLVDGNWKSPSGGKGKGKNKFVDFITNKKGEHEAS